MNYDSNSISSFNHIRLIVSGDINLHPGPDKCSVCAKTIAVNHRALSCDHCGDWCHIKCGNVKPKEYKTYQKMENFNWICPVCLMAALPFADSTLSSDCQNETNLLESSIEVASLTPGLKCLLANARSLKNKLQDFHAMISTENLDIVAITETWLDTSVLDHEIIPSGYTIFRRDRINRIGGGVLLAFKNNLIVTRRIDLEVNCELLWCELTSEMGSRFLFGVYYRPPNSDLDYMSSLEESFLKIENLNMDKVFLVGDFNLPHFDWITHIY